MPVELAHHPEAPDAITRNATRVVIASFEVALLETCFAELTVVARAGDGTSSVWSVQGLFKKNLTTVSRVGALSRLLTRQDAGAAPWDADFTAVGDRIEVGVIGDPEKAVVWYVTGRIDCYLAPEEP